MKMSKRKTGLGRGLSTLLADASNEYNSVHQSKNSSFLVPIDFVYPNKNQPRRKFNKSKIQELSDSIKKNGIIQPVIVRKKENRYEIVAGERRWRAAQINKLHEIPVIVKSLSDQQVMVYAIVENIQREDLNPIEEARGYKTLIDLHGYTQEDLALTLGKSRSYVANSIRLLSLPEKVIEFVMDGKISSGHARALIGVENSVNIAQIVIKKVLSVRQLENLIRNLKADTKKNDESYRLSRKKDIDTINLEQSLKAHLNFITKIQQNKIGLGGQITIHYNNLDELETICNILYGQKN